MRGHAGHPQSNVTFEDSARSVCHRHRSLRPVRGPEADEEEDDADEEQGDTAFVTIVPFSKQHHGLTETKELTSVSSPQ